jgi:3-deoxy-D-manno-octulosonic-acid transferase
MSQRSASGYARWDGLMGPAFRSLRAVCAQSDADAARLRALGAQHVEVTGNLKFDISPDPVQLAAGRQWRRQLDRPVLLLASTREGEEKLLLEELSRSGSVNPRLLIVVVPRHPQRFDEVAPLAQSRRSRGETPAPADRVHLGDTMGEMSFYYGAADVAVIGGSFAPLGGQNLIEALAAGTPVVAGPSMFNFTEATRLALEAGAALQAADPTSAAALALQLISDEQKKNRMAEAGKKLCEMHRGATERHMKVCLALLNK